MNHIKSILKVSEQGVSKPYLCSDESGGIRWCKGCHTGFRAIVCEWICARLADALGLPVPKFEIMRLDVSVFRQWRMLQNGNVPEIVTDFNPYVFASLNVENSKDVFDAKSELSHVDTKLLAKIFWFDLLVRNTDRTDFNSNLLANGSVYIIDHNNAFDPNFSVSGFMSEHILRECRDALSVTEQENFRKSVVELANGSFLDEVWGEMPEEWTDAVEEILPLARVKAVLQEGCDVGIA